MISLFGGLYILVLIIVIESSCFFTINFPLTDAMRRQEPNLEENTIENNISKWLTRLKRQGRRQIQKTASKTTDSSTDRRFLDSNISCSS